MADISPLDDLLSGGGKAPAAIQTSGPDVVGALLMGDKKFHGPREVSQDTDAAADVSDVAVASLANEPKAQIRYYAQEMGIPEDRFGIVDGQIVYQTDNGQLQAVAPGLAREFAGESGPMIPVVAGAVGTVGGMALSAPTGPGALAGGALGGAAGAAGGQFVREGLAKAIMGQEMSAGRVATEGALDMGATLAGLFVGKGIAKAAATRAAKEFSKAMKGGAQDAASALQRTLDGVNAKYGTNIQITPAELTNSAKLRAQQMALQNNPETAEMLTDFAVGRGREADSAFNSMLGEISPPVGHDQAGSFLREAADDALGLMRTQRAIKGSPIYKRAFREAESMGGVDVAPVLSTIDETIKRYPAAEKTLTKIRGRMVAEDGTPVRDLEFLQDAVKEELDDAISAATRKGRGKLAGRLMDVQKALLENLDDQVPTFKLARQEWGDLSGPISRTQGGILPDLAKKTEKDFEYMGARFLVSASPAEISRAKTRIFAKLGKQSGTVNLKGAKAWDATVRGFLEARWEDAARVHKSKIGRQDIGVAAQPAAFWADMVGNPRQTKRLKAAMAPRQWHAFKNLMDVFESTGRALNFNSTTVAQSEGVKSIKSGGLARGAAASVVDAPGVFRRMGAGVEGVFDDMNAKLLASIITNNGSVKELLKIGARNTTRDKAFILAAKAVNMARASAMSGPSGSDEFLPPSLSPQQ